MIAHGSAFPLAKLVLNNSVPPILNGIIKNGISFYYINSFLEI
jgi:hypothetical protein